MNFEVVDSVRFVGGGMGEAEHERVLAGSATRDAPSARTDGYSFLTRLALDDGRFTTTVGATLILGYCLATAYERESQYIFLWPAALLLDWVRDLGIAFIVGGIVSLGIERISRQKFLSEAKDSREQFFASVLASQKSFIHVADAKIDEVKRNFFNSSVLRQYPIEYSAAVLSALELSKFYKKGLNITIDLSVEEAKGATHFPDSIVHEQTSSYQIENVSSAKAEYQPKMFLDCDWDGCPAELMEWRVGEHHLDAEALRPLAMGEASLDTDRQIYEFPHSISVMPGDSIFVLARVRTIKHLRDTTTWCGVQPADSLRFVVNHPQNFEAYIQQKTAARSKVGPIASNGKRVSVEILKPLLPYMTMEYGWRPIDVGKDPGREQT